MFAFPLFLILSGDAGELVRDGIEGLCADLNC